MKYQAFLFDMNGTMIDDMDYHIDAWHAILNTLGAGLDRERVKLECYGKNHELLERVFPGRFTMAEMDIMAMDKERAYQEKYRPELRLIEGLPAVLERAKHSGIKLAIGSAAMRFNVDFVLDGLNIRDYFDVLVTADEVAISKPDPQTFISCAEALGIDPAACLVFEDAPKGVEAAQRAGMDCVVLTTLHEAHEFQQYDNVIATMRDFSLMSL